MKSINTITKQNIIKTSNPYDILLNKFISKINNKMTRKQFLFAFLSTLLLITPSFNYVNIDDNYFNKTMTIYIKETSLCKPEAEFLEEMLYINPANFDAYLDLYADTKDLNKCQLGSIILKMLTYGKSNIEFL